MIRFAIICALLIAACACAQTANSFRDEFSGYEPGSDGFPAWETDSIGWAVQDGKFSAQTAGRSFAICRKASRAKAQVFEVTLTIRGAKAKDWKVAGLALVDDARNFWHLALVESPTAEGAKHYLELQESYEGQWLAAGAEGTRLSPLPGGRSFEWQNDRPYRLRMELTPETLVGTVSELDGTERARFGYKFDNKAVTVGTAGLDCGGFDAVFEDFSVAVSQPLPPKVVTEPTFPPFTAKGYATIRGKATGFFHVEKIGGRWWLITPRGEGFYAVGTDHANYYAHWCEKLGYAPYHKNCVEKYQGDEAAWARSTANRLRAWNFNALGCGWAQSMRDQSLPRDEFITFGAEFSAIDDIAEKIHWTGFPNVFSPQWPAYCEKKARRFCSPLKNDPWIIGYFLDNELEWFGKNGAQWGLFDECTKKPATHSAKQALVAFLKGRYPSLTAFNAKWQTKFADWDALAANTEVLRPEGEQPTADRMAFIALIAEKYFSATAAAVKKADPNHMNLGARFAGYMPQGVIEVAGKYCDVVTVNYYGRVDLERGISPDMPKVFADYFARCRRPMMITEWSFPAYDSGLPCKYGAGQRVATQAEKARCYEVYQTALMAMPWLVGSNYFMWVDEPALGISSTFPEDSNYGLVDVEDKPWPELTAMATKVNARVYDIHAGRTPEVAVALSTDGKTLTLKNSGAVAAPCELALWIDGQKQMLCEKLPANGSVKRTLSGVSKPGGHLVAALADPAAKLPETNRADNSASVVTYTQGLPWTKEMPSRLPIVVSNPSAIPLEKAQFCQLLTTVLPQGKTSVVKGARLVEAGSGQEIACQIDGSGTNAELCFSAGALAPYACKTFLLSLSGMPADDFPAALQTRLSSQGFAVQTGALALTHDSTKADLLATVSTGDLPLGRFHALVHQSVGQELWVAADKTESVQVYDGPVRFAADLTVAATTGGADTKTAAGKEGEYAARVARPHRYRACYRIACYPGQPTFTSRLLWIESTDDEPWELVSYYHYAPSAIGGNWDDDLPTTSLGAGVTAWENPKLDAFYGFIRGGLDDFYMNFWRDPGGKGGEHPDIARDVKLKLNPGQRYEAVEPVATFFGCRGTDTARAILRTAQAAAALQGKVVAEEKTP